MASTIETAFKVCLFVGELAAWIIALILLLAGEPWWAAACAAVAAGADVTGRISSRRSPMPFPHFGHWILSLPRGPHAPHRLMRVLQPSSGERILEIGPGVGVHALPVAAALLPDGVLEVLDVQQEMLDDLMRRASRRGLTNIVPARGDAHRLPYADRTFDAAYLVTVLGEIPDAPAALRELRRVLKPGGRLLIAELFIDPDFISLTPLRRMAAEADFVFERRTGPPLAYSALFRPATPGFAPPRRSP